MGRLNKRILGVVPTPLQGCISLLVVSLGVLGCGAEDGPKRYRVSGKVTFQGQPVEYGIITLAPDTKSGNSGPQATAEIRGGLYDTNQGTGYSGGPALVAISGYKHAPTNSDNRAESLFDDYVITKDLPKGQTTWDIEIPPEAAKPAAKTRKK